jgi:entericidin A
MRKVTALIVLTALSFVLLGCNTVHGFGQDVEKVGEKMQDGSRK